jgi:hypothetical protein
MPSPVWLDGFEDGFAGNEPKPPHGDLAWSHYMSGYKFGKAKAGW